LEDPIREGYGSGFDRGAITRGILQQSLAPCREVMGYPGVIEIQGVQINDIEIGKVALSQNPPVVQAVQPRRIRALATYCMLDGDAAPCSVTDPVL
jgi:hypothetical protein